MNSALPPRHLLRERIVTGAALLALLTLGVLATFGPSGLLAWSEDRALLAEYDDRIDRLREEQAALRNRVALLNPERVDPDLGTELARRDLNVAHPDEYVIVIDPEQ